MKLHHVQLAIPPLSEDECRAFYCDVLGWQELEKPSALAARGGLWLDAGQAEIHLGVEEDFRPARKAHPAFLVTDIARLADTLKDAGHVVKWDDALKEYKRFFTADPVGNRIEFMQAAP